MGDVINKGKRPHEQISLGLCAILQNNLQIFVGFGEITKQLILKCQTVFFFFFPYFPPPLVLPWTRFKPFCLFSHRVQLGHEYTYLMVRVPGPRLVGDALGTCYLLSWYLCVPSPWFIYRLCGLDLSKDPLWYFHPCRFSTDHPTGLILS